MKDSGGVKVVVGAVISPGGGEDAVNAHREMLQLLMGGTLMSATRSSIPTTAKKKKKAPGLASPIPAMRNTPSIHPWGAAPRASLPDRGAALPRESPRPQPSGKKRAGERQSLRKSSPADRGEIGFSRSCSPCQVHILSARGAVT